MLGLQRACFVLGFVPLLTGAAQIVLGGDTVPGAGSLSESAESELRFLSAWWLGAGVLLIWVSRDLAARTVVFRGLCAVLFLSGVARLIAALDAGWPHWWLNVLTGLELALPLLLLAWHARVLRAA